MQKPVKLKNLEKALFFLTLLLLPTQLGRHFWLKFSFVYSLPIDYLAPTIYFWDILVIILAVVYIAQKAYINRLAINLFYFFILTQAVSLFSSGANIGVGLVRIEQFIIAGFFGVYIASQKLKEVSRIFYWGLTLCVLAEAVLAVGQFIKGATVGFWILGERTFSLSTPGIAKFDFYGRDFLRPYSTFPHPNVLAGFLLVASLSLYHLFYPSMKNFLIWTFFASGLVILLTVSRSAIFILFISSLVLLKNRGRLMLAIGAVALLPILYTRYFSLLTFDNLALLRREEFFQIAFKQWVENPILGIGLNNFIPRAADLLLTGPSRFLQPAHNIFLLSLSETGLIGTIGLIGLIGYPIFKKRFSIIWGAIIFLGMFDHYFLTLPQGYRLLFLVWGLTIASLKVKAV